MQNKKLVLTSFIVFILLFISGRYYYNGTKQKSLYLGKKESLLLQRPNSIVVGNKNAKVQLVEFFDPACGTCALFYKYVKDIMKEHHGNIKLVLRYAPFHKNSDYAAKILEGARQQGLFSQTLDFMFLNQSYWVKEHGVQTNILWDMLVNIKGLDMEKLSEFINKPDANKVIKQDIQDGEKLKINKTPSFFVNGEPLKTFGLKYLKSLISSKL